MANPSILAAFERMWQHVVNVLSNKSDKTHTHNLSITDDNNGNVVITGCGSSIS